MASLGSIHKIARTGDSRFLKAVARLSFASGLIAALMILLAVLITCQMIFVRYVLNQSTIWQTEMVVYLVIGATMLGLPYVQHLRGHVNVDLVPIAARGQMRFLLYIVTSTLGIGVVGLMLFYGFEYWYEAYSRNWRSDTVWGVRLWIPYLALPAGFFLFLLQLVADFYAVMVGIERPFGLENDHSPAQEQINTQVRNGE